MAQENIQMGKEILVIPEQHLAEVIKVIRCGLGRCEVSAEVSEKLEHWCAEYDPVPEQ